MTATRRTRRWCSPSGPAPVRASARSTCRGCRAMQLLQLLNALDLRVGDYYDGVELDARLLRYANELRAQGYYEARVAQLPRFVDGDAAVNLVLSIEPGPRVEIVFQGDPLAASDRDRLVPIAREHSVDEDLLEDSKFGIERHFRERGYCNPRVDYQRGDAGPPAPEAQAGVLRVTFTITRGPQCMVEAGRGDGQRVADVRRACAARRHESRPAVQRLHGGLRCAANPGLLPPARVHGGQGDVAGRAARAEVRKRVRAGQARDCRRCALGDRLGDFSGQHGHRCRHAAARDNHRRRVSRTSSRRFPATPTVSPLLYLNRGYPGSDRRTGAEGHRRRFEGRARLQ